MTLMVKITAYMHPIRTYLPCSGVGRHINGVLQQLSQTEGVALELLVSQQWLGADHRLDPRCPLRHLPTRTFPTRENPTERSWKLWGLPAMDRYVPDDSDWVYAPVETYLPISKCPVAVTFHDIQAFEPDLPWSQSLGHRWFRYKWGRWVRRSLRDCRVIFTVSEFSKQRMVALLGADPAKIVVVGNGVDPAFFAAAGGDRSAYPLPTAAPYVFMIGGLRQKKGGDYYLAVAEELRRRRSPLHIVIAGEQDAAYGERAKTHHNIHLLGRVPDAALPPLMAGAVALLFLSPYEGFGIPPLEAMAAGVPAVVANRASLPEVVGEAGLVVEPDCPGAIADCLMALAGDRQLRQRYIDRGRRHAAQFTWAACGQRVLAALEQFA